MEKLGHRSPVADVFVVQNVLLAVFPGTLTLYLPLAQRDDAVATPITTRSRSTTAILRLM
jgi:hypothetical protein